MRHAESTANVDRIVSNRDSPHPLTERGVQQVEDLAASLKGRKISKIYSSPIIRARQTAQILADRLNLDVELADGLREYDCGELEGKGDDETWREHYRVVNAWLVDQEFDEKSPGGEDLHDIMRRFYPFVSSLRQIHGEDEAVLLVGHGGTYRAMMPMLCDNVPFSFVVTALMPNTVVIEVEVWEHVFECVRWNGLPVP